MHAVFDTLCNKPKIALSTKKILKFSEKNLKIYDFFLHNKKQSQNHKFMITIFCDSWFVILWSKISQNHKSRITKSHNHNHKFCDRNHKIKSGQIHEKRLGIRVKTKSQNHKSHKITITNFVIVICDFVIVILWFVICDFVIWLNLYHKITYHKSQNQEDDLLVLGGKSSK